MRMIPGTLKAICVILAFLGVIQPAASGAAERPNVVVLLADDLGYGDLSCYGSPEIETPALDGLAAAGARFTDFYAGSAVCSPSRAALLTGRFPVRASVYSWIHSSHNMHLRDAERTLAEVLKGAGYKTAHVGKWHLSYDLAEGSGPDPDPGDQGFDHWVATGNNANPSHRDPKNFVRNGEPLGKIEGYSSHIVAEEAIGWLEDRKGSEKPFYLNVWFHEPHRKVAAPKELRQRHQDTRKPAYYGCIENMDRAIGRLLEKLEAIGAAEDTMVIFASDNGSYMRDPAGKSNGGLKGRKTQLWEGGIRVPGIIRWPGHVEAGRVIEEPAGLVDILPTVAEAVDAPLPDGVTIDGTSLLPLLENSAAFERGTPLYWFYSPSRPVCVIREGDWSLVADPTLELPRQNFFEEAFIGKVKRTGLTNFRLYNVRRDPAQKHNVAAEHPGRLEAMKREMIELHKDVVAEAYDWRRAE